MNRCGCGRLELAGRGPYEAFSTAITPVTSTTDRLITQSPSLCRSLQRQFSGSRECRRWRFGPRSTPPALVIAIGLGVLGSVPVDRPTLGMGQRRGVVHPAIQAEIPRFARANPLSLDRCRRSGQRVPLAATARFVQMPTG